MGNIFTRKAYDKTNHHFLDPHVTFCKVAIVLLVWFTSTGVSAQIAVTQSANTQSLAQLLAGTGVTISNYTKTCDNNGTGTFTATNTNLGITQGVVLASGRVQNISQAANNFASTQFTNSADVQLSGLTVGTIYDKCILEFDIVPQGTDLRFEYVFASEEYPEFVCSPYNDVFGFFISGPNPAGGVYANKNIATVPNTTTPVFINSVNTGISGTYSGTTWNSANCQALNYTNYYVNNLNPVNQGIVYDGMTVVLPATAKVVPCQTYHLKLAIADVGDRIYDSGVFLKAYSFTSAAVTVSASAQLDYAGFTSAYEGCVGGTFTVNTSTMQTVDDTIDITVTGTATNGTDYTSIPTQVVIPAGQTSVNIPLTPLVDGIAEAAETVTITVLNPCSGLPVSSATLSIEDNIPISINVSDSLLCSGQSAILTATGGLAYSWAPASTLSSTNTNSTSATPTSNTNYTVTVSFGGCSQVLSQMLYISNPSVTATSSGVSCGGSSVTISSSVNNGIAPINYAWSNGSTGASAIVNSAGVYALTITDAYGCSANTTASVTASNLTISPSVSNVSCFGGSNGSATINTSGGSMPYTINWSNGMHTSAISNLTQGIYGVTVIDVNGCSVASSLNVAQPTSVLTASTATNTVSCYGGNNGSVNLTTNGGTTPYTYHWNNNAATEDLQNIAAGSYAVTVTDANNCSTTAQEVVAQPASGLSVAATPTNVACFGNNTGSVATIVSGGTTPYNFLWNTGGTSSNPSNMAAGSYTVTVTDANGCSGTKSVSITQPSASLSASLTTGAVACYGNTTGSVISNTSGGTAPYNFAWSNNAVTAILSNVGAGSYTLTVTDANSCSVTVNATVNQPTSVLTASVVTNAVSCYGGSSGSVNLTANGGTTPYTYHWNNNAATEDLQNIAAGSYAVTVTDANNCSATAQAMVAQPASSLSVAATPTNVACFGNSSGSVVTAVNGGTNPYSYLWNTGETTPNISGISAGSYVVTASDANGCSAVSSIFVTQPSNALTTTLATSPVACFGNSTGSITSSTTGGTTPYTFMWSNNSNSAHVSGISAGYYSLTVTDANSCSVEVSASIVEPTAALTASVTTLEVSCYGGNNGSVHVTANGGTAPYSYLWSNGSAAQTLQNVSSGSYPVTVTDAHGCSAAQQATVTQPSAPVYAATSIDSVSCFGGNNGGITASVIGGTPPYSFVWSNSQTTQNLTSVIAGNYSVTVTDSKNCTTTVSAHIAQPTAALQVISAKTDVSCYGSHDGEVALTANGGTPPYFFEWSNNSAQQNQTGLVAGNYMVTATDVNGCSVTGNNQINQPAPLVLSISHTNVLCYGSATGGAQVSVSGGTPGYTFTWSNGKSSSVISNITAGSYTVTVNDNNQCSASASLVVSQPSAGINASAYVKHVSCKGGSDGAVFLTVNGGTSPFTYLWSNAAVTQHVQNLVTGSYTVTITDANGCQSILTNVIAEPSALTLAESHSSVKCHGGNNGAAQLIVTGGTAPYSYSWSNGSNVPVSQNLAAGSYFVTVNDAHQCSATTSFGIGQPQPLTLSLNHSNAVCFGSATGAIQATVNGGTTPYNYTWSNGANTNNLNGVAAGTYTLTVIDANGCSLAAAKTIQQPTAIVIAETHTTPACFGSASGGIDVTVSGGNPAYTYLWSNGSIAQNLQNLVAGTYTVTVNDNSNCTAVKSVSIAQPAPVTLSEMHTRPSCKGNINGTIIVTATGGTPAYQYFWSNGSNNSQINNLSAGTYGVTVVDANGCGAALAAILITEPDSIAVALTATDVKCSETATGTITSSVSGGTLPYHYHWSNNASSSSLQNMEAGVYSLSVTDANGCSALSTAMVNDVPPLVIKGVGDSVPCSVAKGSVTLWVDGGVAPYALKWSNGAATQNLSQVVAGAYTVTVTDANGCHVDTTLEVENLNQFTVDALGGGTVTLGQTVELHSISTGSSSTTYQWTPAQGINCPACANTTALPTRFTVYTVVATDTNGCFAQDTVSADVIEDYTVFTPNAFTPNGDGNNDYFEFYGNAAGLKHINIMIFDRWGEKIFEADEPTFKWDGMYKGELVPPGVYVYVMKLVFINGHAERIHKGSLTVIR